MQNYENKNFLKELGQRVKSRRLDLGLSQEELAQRCNYAARSSINRLEQGLLDIPQSKVMAVAKALDVTPAFLMGWESELNNPLKVVKDDMRLTGIEKIVIAAFHEADEYTQGLVIRSLGLDKEIEECKKRDIIKKFRIVK